MRRRGLWILLIAVLAAGGGGAWLLATDTVLDLGLEDAAHGAEAGLVPTTADVAGGGLAGLSEAQRAREREKAEAAAKAAATPTFTKAEGVFGQVVDRRGAGIPAARISLFALDPMQPWGVPEGAPVATAVAADDGTFLVGPAPERAGLRVKAEAAGYAAALAYPRSRGAHVVLELDRGGAARVRVTDEAGAPLKGAEVRSQATGSTATAGPDGVALLDALPPGPAPLRVQLAGYASVNLQDVVVEAGKTTERATSLVRGTRIEGSVVDAAGAAVGGAEVAVRTNPGEPAGSSAPVTADEHGKFSLVATGAGGEWISVAASKAGYATGVAGVMLQASGLAQSVTVKLSPELKIAGRVEDAAGAPVVGATVVHANPGRYGGGRSAAVSATTGEDGAFALPLPQAPAQEGQSYHLAAAAPGKGVGSASWQSPKAGAPLPAPLVIKLTGAGTVEGLVKTEAGEPIEGAILQLTMDWNQRQVQLASGAVRNEDMSARRAVQDPRLARLSTATDGAGAFRLEDVPAGTYQAYVTWGLFADQAPEPVTVRAGARETVTLTVGGGTTIEGHVRDGNGAPVAGATIQAHDPAYRGPQWRGANARSDADGRFVLRGVRGTSPWSLSVAALGYRHEQRPNVRPGEKDVDVRLTVLGWIEGVALVDGTPYARTFTVSAQAQGPNAQDRDRAMSSGEMVPGVGFVGRGGGSVGSTTVTSADGKFVVRGLVAGSYTLNVTTRDGLVPGSTPSVSVVDGRATGPVEIALQRGASLGGVVIDEATRAPLAQAWVSVNLRTPATSGGGATAGNAQTDASGRFLVQGLASGTFLVQVNPPTGVSLEDEVSLQRGRAEERTFVAPRSGWAVVRVVDGEQGTGVAHAQVSFLTERGTMLHPNFDAIRREGRIDFSQPDAWQRIHQTDAAGGLVRTLLPPGKLQVQVHAPGYPQPPNAWIVVQPDQATDVVVTLEKAK